MARKPIQRKSRAAARAPAAEGEFEVVEDAPVEKAAKPPLATEGMLVLITFVALIAAFVLINLELRHAFGKGWPV